MVKQLYFKGGGQKYTKYNKLNNNSENFRRQDCCPPLFQACIKSLIVIVC